MLPPTVRATAAGVLAVLSNESVFTPCKPPKVAVVSVPKFTAPVSAVLRSSVLEPNALLLPSVKLPAEMRVLPE